MSIDKFLIEELFKQGFGYTSIADQVGLSRQRVHQIVKNYKNSGKKNREDKYRDLGLCEECNSETASILHHKDFNNENDKMDNLQKLCYPCHVKKHQHKEREYRKNEVEVKARAMRLLHKRLKVK